MFRDLAGIDTVGEGYRRISIRPGVPSASSNPDVPPVSWARAEYDSIRGVIRSAWRRTVKGLEVDVAIPANTSATVVLPAASTRSVREGGKPLERVRTVRVQSEQDGQVVMEVGSGTYRFEVVE